MKNDFLHGKRVLFFSAQAFGYQNEIESALERAGAQVDYFDERPANSFLVKALIRLNRRFLSRTIDRYYTGIIEGTRNRNYDYIFFIKGESVAPRHLECMKTAHPTARLLIYHWDSIANNRNALRILPFFDKVFSFDRRDCEKRGVIFLPLFYGKSYEKIPSGNVSFRYDLMFVGTIHSDRYRFIRNLQKQAEKYGNACYFYLFFQSRILYYKMKLLHKDFRRTHKRDFRFLPLDKAALLRLYGSTRIVIDAQHPRQTGLTMRCIETLGAKRKLITANADIRTYDFYDPDNILVVDRYAPLIPEKFIRSPYKPLPENLYTKYSVDNWIGTIFGSEM